jgi:hypothetical protein
MVLSPAAQAVLDAADSAFEQAGTTRQGIAAALRAAADQGRRGPEHWEGSHPDDFDKGWDAAMYWVAKIAAELDHTP